MGKFEYDLLLTKNRFHTHYIRYQHTPNVDMKNIHSHAHYEILYIFENERVLIAEKKKYVLNKNCIALIPPCTLHRTLGSSESAQIKYKKYLIGFTKDFVDKISMVAQVDIFTAFLQKQIVIPLEDSEAEFVRNTMAEMLKYNNNGDLCDEQLFLMLLCSLLTFFSKKIPKEDIYNENMLVGKMIRYMEENFEQEITLDVLAKQFFVSKYEISRIFSKSMGVSFVEYLTRIRIDNSKKLLQDTSLPITRIAELTGFHSSSNFSRVFKKTTGISPAQYRKALENEYE